MAPQIICSGVFAVFSSHIFTSHALPHRYFVYRDGKFSYYKDETATVPIKNRVIVVSNYTAMMSAHASGKEQLSLT
jgi:hypothetical protein